MKSTKDKSTKHSPIQEQKEQSLAESMMEQKNKEAIEALMISLSNLGEDSKSKADWSLVGFHLFFDKYEKVCLSALNKKFLTASVFILFWNPLVFRLFKRET